MGLERFLPWGKKGETPQERVEPTLNAQEMAAQVQAGAAESDPPGIQVTNVGEGVEQPPVQAQEDDPAVAAALASIQEEDAGAPTVPPSETKAPASMTVGPDFKRPPVTEGVQTMPSLGQSAAPDELSPQGHEAAHLEAKRPIVETPAPTLQERLLSSTAVPPQVAELSPNTAALKQDLDALIGKAEAAKQETSPAGEVISQPTMHLENTFDTYMYAGGRLRESDKESLRRIHKEALASENPHETALELYQKEFKNAYDADLQEAFLTSVALDKDAPQLEAVEPIAQEASTDNQRIRPDGKIEPTLGTPPKHSDEEARDMGDGRIEPPRLKIKRRPEDIESSNIDDETLEKELGAVAASLMPKEEQPPQGERKVKGMILDTDPQVKLLKKQLNDGTLTREQYYKEIAKMKAAAPEVTIPADETTRDTTVASGETTRQPLAQPKEKVGPVTAQERDAFIQTGAVAPERLQDIARKVASGEQLSDAENEIFTDKTGEINDIIAQGAKSEQNDENIEEGELWSIAKRKPLYGAARTSATNAQIKRIEEIQARGAIAPQTEGVSAEGGGATESEQTAASETGVEGEPVHTGSTEGSEPSFLQLEMFAFSDAFSERVKTLLEKSTQEIDEDETMDILDSLADALLKDNDAKFERQKNKLRELCGDAKTEEGRSLLDALLFELQKEMLRNAVEQTERRKAQERAEQQREEGSYSREQVDQILNAVAVAEQRGYERATETAKELTRLSVEKAEARGVSKTLRAIIGGAAVGAVSIGGAVAAAPTLGVAIGGLTIGTAAVAGGGLGIAVAGAAMAIGILNKDDKKE